MSARLRLPNLHAAFDDRTLLSRFADERDQTAFEQLVKRHGGLVYGVCKRTVRDRHLAEDAYQAVFLVLARNPTGAINATSIGGWLFGAARRVSLAARRHELRHEKRIRRAGEFSLPFAHETSNTDFDDLLRVLDEELAAIPDEFRAALVVCFLEERTQDEAAHELGWSLSTLRRRLDRGKELLRSRLSRRGVALSASLMVSAIAGPARATVLPVSTVPSSTTAALVNEAFRQGIRIKLLTAIVSVTLVASGLAFGLTSDSAHSSPPNPTKSEPPPAITLAPAPHAVETKQWIALSGQVVFPKERKLPKPRLLLAENIKDADVWKPFLPLRHEDIAIDPDNRGIANAVVFLRPDSNDRKAVFPPSKIHPRLVNAKSTDYTVFASAGQFTPRVLAVRAGDRVSFNNLLPVPTNVRYNSAQPDRGFNLLIGRGMSHTTKPLLATRLPDPYSSSIYPWMKGYVWAFDHPYFAVTSANGRFEIPHAPAGKWRVVVWHEVVGYLGGAAGGNGITITIPESPSGKQELPPMSFESKNWPDSF